MCTLVDRLSRLKKSSMEAVDNEHSFDDFKQYMHVYRPVENNLIDIIIKAKNSNKKSLVLVCGNVGDGKSHLLSYLNYKSLLDGFYIHNDATESLSYTRNEKQELAKVLDEFCDEKIDNISDTKVIVAINLGVLSNFIESEEGRCFKRLAEYVTKNKILVDTEIASVPSEDSVFFHINFGDYHIYKLKDGRVESPYVNGIMEKIFDEKDDNSFNDAYFDCHSCQCADFCPVKCNFEMMRNSVVRQGVAKIIIEAVVKDKIILSTRELLEFIYDIVVPPAFNEEAFMKYKGDKFKLFLENALPSLLYGHDDISQFFNHIQQYDFVKQRTEEFDILITRFYNTENAADVLKAFIPDNPCLQYILYHDSATLNSHKPMLLLFMARMCKIAVKDDLLTTINNEFTDFVANLYYAVRNDKSNLKSIYDMVKKCVFLWNGADNGRITLSAENENYTISTPLELSPNLTQYADLKSEREFDTFPLYINVSFSPKNDSSKKATLSIDYDLYLMLKRIEHGYRPTVRDGNFYAGFVSFAKKISAFGRSDEEVIITQYDKDESKEYILEKNDFGSYEFKKVK